MTSAQSAPRPRRLGSVRARITVVTTLIVAVALTVAGFAIVLTARSSLVNDLRTELGINLDYAREELNAAVLAEIAADADPEVSGETPDEELAAERAILAAEEICNPIIDDAFDSVGVFDDDEVDLEIEGAFADYTDCMRDNGVDDYPEPSFESSEDFAAGGFFLPGEPGAAAVVLPPLDAVRDSISDFTTVLLVAFPLVVVLMAVATWVVVGRVLRPVEAIRAEVAEIGAAGLDRRVPEPVSDDEIGRLARTMNAMLDRLHDSTERQRRFVSDASHELRSPIASIRTQVEVALEHPETADWPALAGGVLADNERMQHLVDDLLDLARADEGVLVVNASDVDFDDLVLGEAGRITMRRVDTSGVGAVRIRGDAALLSRAVRNLIENAARYADSVVWVDVEIGTAEAGPDETARFIVEDDGAGIAPGDRKRVFERFTRLEQARTREAGGAGLGLALVKEIAHAHGGDVWVEEPRRACGARFVFVVPLRAGGRAGGRAGC